MRQLPVTLLVMGFLAGLVTPTIAEDPAPPPWFGGRATRRSAGTWWSSRSNLTLCV